MNSKQSLYGVLHYSWILLFFVVRSDAMKKNYPGAFLQSCKKLYRTLRLQSEADPEKLYKNLGESLITAIKSVDVDLVEQLLKNENCDPNYTDKTQCFPLFYATRCDCNGCLEILSLLIQGGADVNRVYRSDNSEEGSLMLTETEDEVWDGVLLYAGADVEARYTTGFPRLGTHKTAPPLYWAILNNRPHTVKRLLQYNAPRNLYVKTKFCFHTLHGTPSWYTLKQYISAYTKAKRLQYTEISQLLERYEEKEKGKENLAQKIKSINSND